MIDGERFNGISHLVGAVAAFAAATVLVVNAARYGDAYKIVGVSVYGATLFLLFLVSTLYHSLRGRAKAVFQRLDHAFIYVFIAASYTPFCLVTLRGPWGWTLLGVIWGLAAVGVVWDCLPRRGARIFPVILYLAMGWLVLIALYPLMRALPTAALTGLALGGLLYTLGVVFFALEGRLRFAHEIWHVFVLAGSAAHFAVIAVYV